MVYLVEWIVADRVVLMRWVGDQTAATVEEGVTHLSAFLTKGTPPVHVISDLRYIGSFPTSLASLKKLMVRHENAGQALAVGGNTLSRFVSTMLTRFSGAPVLTFKDSLGEALTFLERVDPSLPQGLNYTDRPPNIISE